MAPVPPHKVHAHCKCILCVKHKERENAIHIKSGSTKYLLDHVNNLGHVIRHAWFNRRRQAMKMHHIVMEFFTIAPAQTHGILPQFISSSNYLQNFEKCNSAILSYQYRKQLAANSCSTIGDANGVHYKLMPKK